MGFIRIKEKFLHFTFALSMLAFVACAENFQVNADAISSEADNNSTAVDHVSDLEKNIEKNQKRLPASDIYTRMVKVDKPLAGYEMLFGTRNFRAVLDGLIYRGGVNHSTTPGYEWPLAKASLERLCKEGFAHVVYLYRDTMNGIIPETKCTTYDGRSNVMKYEYISPFNTAGAKKLQTLVHNKLQGRPNAGPVYLHCHDGHHASGLISALILRQFCGFTASEALAYWEKATDGEDGSQFNSVRERVVNSSYMASLPAIDEKIRTLVCPSGR